MKTKLKLTGKGLAAHEIEGYIGDDTIYDSSLLYRLSIESSVTGETKEAYRITEPPYRPDLIAENYYGDITYESYVILQAGGLRGLVTGEIIQMYPKTVIDKLKNG